MGNNSENKFSCKILTWNIAGIAKVGKVKDYLEGFEVIVLQETWLEKEKEKEWIGKMGKKYNWVTKAAERVNRKGRAKGGILVGVRKGLKNDEIIEWRYGLVIKGLIIKKEVRINIIVVYITM